jgi:hypothetical protein
MPTVTLTPVPAGWKGVRDVFAATHPDIQSFFAEYPGLLEKFSWETCMAYLFTKIEQGHRRALYCGVVKLHSVDPELAWRAIQRWEMTRAGFRQQLDEVLQTKLPKDLADVLEEAEDVRDKVIHGYQVPEVDHRRGAVRALDYTTGFRSLIEESVAKFSPYGDLRGFSGAAKKLSKATSRLVLKGLGFAMG